MTRLASLERLASRASDFLTRGRAHEGRLADIDIRIAVTGTRGKSTTTTWLYEAFDARGYDTYAKVTGENPHSLYGGDRYPIERSGPVTLYETEREIRRFSPRDVLLVENQGIREYTTRLVNTRYVDPTVVVLTNVRRDHLDTLGRNRLEIARAFARSIPRGTTVVSGERNEAINAYLERELERAGATLVRAVTHADEFETPADELVAMVDAVLRTVGAEPLSSAERDAFRARHPVQWVHLPGGRLYDAANVNDVESTEIVRRALMSATEEPFRPLVYFRSDRPGRTASFIEYLNALADAGLVDEVHAVGAHRRVATRSLTVPVTWYDERVDSPADVLDAVLAADRPVIVMGNVVPAFMQDLQTEIRRRTAISDAERLDDSRTEPTLELH
jgi:hypothetical protein